MASGGCPARRSTDTAIGPGLVHAWCYQHGTDAASDPHAQPCTGHLLSCHDLQTHLTWFRAETSSASHLCRALSQGTFGLQNTSFSNRCIILGEKKKKKSLLWAICGGTEWKELNTWQEDRKNPNSLLSRKSFKMIQAELPCYMMLCVCGTRNAPSPLPASPVCHQHLDRGVDTPP